MNSHYYEPDFQSEPYLNQYQPLPELPANPYLDNLDFDSDFRLFNNYDFGSDFLLFNDSTVASPDINLEASHPIPANQQQQQQQQQQQEQPQHQCDQCTRTFDKKWQLNRHRKGRHEKPFRCVDRDCSQRFGLRKDRDRHIKAVHSELRSAADVLTCLFSGCTTTSTRRDAMAKHLRLVHGFTLFNDAKPCSSYASSSPSENVEDD